MVIVVKKYLPFVENWSGSDEFPRKEHESNHVGCAYFKQTDGIHGKCTRRDVTVIKEHLHCKFFVDKNIHFVIGSTTPASIGYMVVPNTA